MAKIDSCLSAMLNAGGDTLHISSGRPPMYRKKEVLFELEGGEFAADKVSEMLKEICPERGWEKFQNVKDFDFTYDSRELAARFRCNCFFDRSGVGAVLQLIPARIPSLDDLEIPPVYKELCHLPGGLILVCGQPGSGTGNTRAAMIEYINENTSRYIVSITRLVEFTHRPIRSIVEQCEVPPENMADAISAAILSHPDVLVLDSLPDARSVRLALRAAMMGILVIASPATGNCAKTLEYMVDIFPPEAQGEARALLAESLQAILPQVSCRSSDGGRVICYEILLRAGGLPTAIRSDDLAAIYEIMDSYRPQGMRTLDFSLRELLATGRITADEAYARALDKKQFQPFLMGH